MSDNRKFDSETRRYIVLIVAFWSIVASFSFFWNIAEEQSSALENAALTARATLDKDLAYRRWAAHHGGVYVPVTEETPPNPYLSDAPNRDLVTKDNQQLTLINPFYVTRQVFELDGVEGSVRAHITSLNPIRPENKPDLWEAEALRSFSEGTEEVISVEEIDGRKHLRLMRPLITENSCLKCHGNQGYQLGDIRGGLSISVPLGSFSHGLMSHYTAIIISHSLIWILGTGIILYGGRRLILQESEKAQAEHDLRLSEGKYRGLFNDALDMIHTVDKNGNIVDANPMELKTLGYSREEYVGKPLKDIVMPECRSKTMQSFARLLRGEVVLGYLTTLLTKDGATVNVEVNAFPVFLDGEFHSATGILRDVTRHISIEKELKQHRENLQQLVRQRTTELEVQIAERKATEAELRRSESFATKLANLSVSGVYIFDSNKRKVMYVNPQYTNITGYTLQDYENMTQEETGALFRPEAFPALELHMEKLLNGKEGEIHEIEYELRRADGKWIWCVAYNTVFERDMNGNPTRIMGALLDITRRKQAEQAMLNRSRDLEDSRRAALNLMEDAEEERIRAECAVVRLQESERLLREAKEEAEAANQAKSTFLANMTHEIRTPMNAILGFAQIMRNDDRLTEKQARHLRSITTSGEHLLSLINDILEMSKIEAGFLELNLISFDLYGLLEDLAAIFRSRTQAQHLDFSVHINTDVPKYINSDERKLRQILLNLISNAIKFTEKGTIQVKVEQTKQAITVNRYPDRENGEQVLRFSVRDSGIGIPQEEMSNLFKVFEQTSSGRQIHEGTGLGLAISQQFARLMGGDISAESELGRGSTFTFEIFVTESKKPDQVGKRRRIRHIQPGQHACHVLVTDDRDSNREVLRQILEPLGFQVTFAMDGMQALEAVSTRKPDLVLMDAKMPVMDGYEALRRIRSNPKTRDTLVIMVTASAFEEDRKFAESVGVNGFLSKPVNLDNLLEMIGRVTGIEYEYYDEAEKSESLKPEYLEIDPSELAGVQPSIAIGIRTAANIGDLYRLEELISKLSTTHPELAIRLQEILNSFNLDYLASLFTAPDP